MANLRYYPESDGGKTWTGSHWSHQPKTYYVVDSSGGDRIDCKSWKEAKEKAHELNMQAALRSYRVAVLGRGKSLVEYPKYSHLFDKIVLVNPFSREIDSLGEEHFSGKLLHVICKALDCRLTDAHYRLFSEVVTTANGKLPPSPWQSKYPNFQLFDMTEHGFPNSDELDMLLIHAFLDEGIELDRILEKFPKSKKRWWPTTGIFAIDLALELYYPQDVFLFGFDCYDDGFDSYMVGQHNSHQTPRTRRLMKLYLDRLVRHHPETVFWTANPTALDEKRANWKAVKEYDDA